MKTIKRAERELNLKAVEERIQKWWEENKIYEKSKEALASKPKYYFLDGPPYASGAIHLGTAWNKILKDAITRYLAMKGLNVRRQAGWDCHGLPIEVKVEEKLGIKNKKEIEELGIDKFVAECKKWAYEHVKIMTSQSARLGVWMDWSSAYMTLTDDYIEAAWWTMKKAQEKKLLTKDLRVVAWCPRCETALADAEMEYEDRSDPSIYVKFPLAQSGSREDEYFLIWTTTPWTLIGNLAVMVNPDFEYAYAKTKEGVLILAKELAHILKEKLGLEYEIIKTVPGKALKGMKYRNPLSDVINLKPESKNAYTVILSSEYVTLGEGTGCVHCAPGHGPEDFEAGAEYGIEPLCPVDEQGRFTEEAGKYAGMLTKKDDKVIINDLKENHALLHYETIVHRYGHCWRCKTPIIYRATEQWFIKITELKEKMLKEIDRVEWVPEWAGSARFKDWVANSKDWTISRQRYWGIPLPVWVCGKCSSVEVIGSRRELGTDVPELHRPFVDEVKLPCKCGGIKSRVSDVLDVWFDSGVATWASLGYPASEEEFKKWYPCDFITEGHDQTRGWFYSMLGCGVVAFNEVPYRRVLMHGFTLDEKGEKMSKSLGNVVQPEEVIEKYGAEVLRFYVLWANKPWEDLRFNWEEVKVVAKMFNVLWNAYVFATTYMNIDRFEPFKEKKMKYKIEDRWILSRLHSLIKEVTEAFETLHIYRAQRALSEFILEDLSRWYIILIRPRIWIEKDDPEKLGAYAALHEVFVKLSILLAPIAPHLSEEIYKNMSGRKESVHLEPWVKFDENAIDASLEEEMKVGKKFVEAVAAAREKKGIKRRWPVRKVIYSPSDEKAKKAIKNLAEIVKTQSNTFEIEIMKPSEEFENFSSAEFEFGKVFLDTTKTDEILAKGYAREVVRRIQEMRKEQDLEIEAYIEAAVEVQSPETIALLKKQAEYISGETRAKKLEIAEKIKLEGYTKEWRIGEDVFKISIRLSR